jgi:polyhydroxybutyrate depolymerase
VGIPQGALALAALGLMLTASAHAQAARPRAAAVAATTAAPPGGCRRPVTPGTSTITIRIAGRDRSARLYNPRRGPALGPDQQGGAWEYPAEHALPLVVNLHGSGANAAVQEEQASRMDATADAHGFLVAYPQGERRTGNGFAWNIPGTPAWSASGPDDVAFIRQLVAAVRASYCVAPGRVYGTGFSGGARMVSQLACAADPIFAAVAPVGGLRAPSPCPAGPVPVLGIHGSADLQNPYEGHGQSYWTYGVPEAAHRWAVHNGCGSTAAVRTEAPGVTVAAYHGCHGSADVELHTVLGKGHQWPAVSRSGGFVPNEVIWRFFAAHRLPDHERVPPQQRGG